MPCCGVLTVKATSCGLNFFGMGMCTGKPAGHRVIPASGRMIKHNGKELHSTAHDRAAPKVTMAECREFNRKADEFFARRGIDSCNWKSNSHRGVTHRTTNRRPSCGG